MAKPSTIQKRISGILKHWLAHSTLVMIAAGISVNSAHAELLPLQDYYNQNTQEGRFFHRISRSLQREEGFNYLLISGDLTQPGDYSIFTHKGWSRLSNTLAADDMPKYYYANGTMKASAVSIRRNVGDNAYLCDIRLKNYSDFKGYQRVWGKKVPLRHRRVLLHELGHCVYSKFTFNAPWPVSNAKMEEDLAGLAYVGSFDGQAMKWVNKYQDGSLYELYKRYLIEIFADVYAYAYIVHRDGTPSDVAVRSFKTRTIGLLRRGDGPTYFTLPFIYRAAERRSEIGNYSSLSGFVSEILTDLAPESFYTRFNENIVAHLYMNGKLPKSKIKNEARVNRAIRIIKMLTE